MDDWLQHFWKSFDGIKRARQKRQWGDNKIGNSGHLVEFIRIDTAQQSQRTH